MDISDRYTNLMARIKNIAVKTELSVALYSCHPRFPENIAKEISSVTGARVDFFSYENKPDFSKQYDIFILLCHAQFEQKLIWNIRMSGVQPQPVIAVWTWDNHHLEANNLRTAHSADLVFAAHDFCSDYLKNPFSLYLEHLPLCCNQWTAKEASLYIKNTMQRKDALYGGYYRYNAGKERNELLDNCIKNIKGNSLALKKADDRDDYFAKFPESRFKDWAGYKTSLCLPLTQDLSSRFFDALVTGQIPIIPSNIPDIYKVIPKKMREELPVIIFDDYSVEGVKKAHQKALKAFDADGVEGVMRRHKFATENHMLENRVFTIIKTTRKLAESAGVTVEMADEFLYAKPI